MASSKRSSNKGQKKKISDAEIEKLQNLLANYSNAIVNSNELEVQTKLNELNQIIRENLIFIVKKELVPEIKKKSKKPNPSLSREERDYVNVVRSVLANYKKSVSNEKKVAEAKDKLDDELLKVKKSFGDKIPAEEKARLTRIYNKRNELLKPARVLRDSLESQKEVIDQLNSKLPKGYKLIGK